MTISGSGNWTGDDILLASAETYALLPRPSGTATAAFLTLLREYWPGSSGGTRAKVSQCLRGSARTALRVLEALDEYEGGSDADGLLIVEDEPASSLAEAELRLGDTPATEAAPAHVEVQAAVAAPAPVLAEAPIATGSAHARDTIRHLAATGERGPEVQPAVIARQLRDAREPSRELATLLRLPEGGAAMVMADARGVLVALRALGIETSVARGLVARWHAAVPPGFESAYEALALPDCLDVVAAWRGAALAAQKREPLRAAG